MADDKQVVVVNAKDEEYKYILQHLEEVDHIESILVPNDPTIIPGDEENLVLLRVILSSGTEKDVLLKFDDYLKLANSSIWDNPNYSRDAELVTMDRKMEYAAPYNLFYNTLKYCPETTEQLYSINFTDLLCPSLGKLKCSFHITFMAQLPWILSNFALRKLHKLPMTIIHGYDKLRWLEDEIMETFPNVDSHYIARKEGSLGLHHSKLSIFVYDDDSLRLVIGTANLYAGDWDLYNQEMWVSPRCPKLPEGSSVLDGESPTGFKCALLDYLFAYSKQNIPNLKDWTDRVKEADFKEIKVSFLYTVPGVHYPRKNGSLVHFLGHLLSKDCTIPAPKEEQDLWPVVALTASLGLVGRTPEEWLTTNFLKCLGSHKRSPYLPMLPCISKVPFNLIFPTINNCLNGYLGPESAICCNYEKGVNEAQPWLLRHKFQWKTDGTKRTRAIAHTKCYCRISPDWEKMAYYFLTSANLSRSAWGTKPNKDSSIYVRSYETGVLFLPKYFDEDYFEIIEVPGRKNKKLFPVMFDLPLTPYGPEDDPYCAEELLARLKLDESSSDSDERSESQDKTENIGDKTTRKSFTKQNKNIEKLQKRVDSDAKNTVSTQSSEKTNDKTIGRKDKEQKFTNPPVLMENNRDMKYKGKSTNDFFPF